jgi:hypothetical protein
MFRRTIAALLLKRPAFPVFIGFPGSIAPFCPDWQSPLRQPAMLLPVARLQKKARRQTGAIVEFND